MNYENERTKAKTLAFVIMSTLFHVGLATAVVHFSYKTIKELPEVTEFEILGGEEPAAPELTANEPIIQAPEIQPEPAVVAPAPKPIPAPVLKSQAKPAVVKSSAPAPTMADSLSEKTELEKSEEVAEEASRSALAAPIAALDTPTIEDSELPAIATEPVDEKQIHEDIEQDLNKVETDEVKTAAVDEDVEKAIQDKDDSLKAALAEAQAQDEKEHQERAQAIAADKAKAAELQSQEDAQAAAAALAAKEAADKAAAERAAAAQAAQALAATQAAEALAKANQVRALEELRQKPGNKKPQYDNDDRLNGRVGEVSFHAFINKAGEPIQFKLVKSTGFKTLDLKTLKAIKSWKFYPGQEGWVEIPFKWDLQGGAKEMPATLRRKVSQN